MTSVYEPHTAQTEEGCTTKLETGGDKENPRGSWRERQSESRLFRQLTSQQRRVESGGVEIIANLAKPSFRDEE